MENNLQPWEIELNKVVQQLDEINKEIKEINEILKNN